MALVEVSEEALLSPMITPPPHPKNQKEDSMKGGWHE